MSPLARMFDAAITAGVAALRELLATEHGQALKQEIRQLAWDILNLDTAPPLRTDEYLDGKPGVGPTGEPL